MKRDRFQSIGKYLAGIVPCVAIVLVVVQFIVTNEFVGMKDGARQVDATIGKLQDERDVLSQAVASASALATISQRAAEAGFIEPSKSQYFVIDTLSVAARLPTGELPTLQ